MVKKAKSDSKADSSSSSSENGGAKVEKTKDAEFEEAVRDLKISWIGKSVITRCHIYFVSLQCFDAVGWAAGRASGL